MAREGDDRFFRGGSTGFQAKAVLRQFSWSDGVLDRMPSRASTYCSRNSMRSRVGGAYHQYVPALFQANGLYGLPMSDELRDWLSSAILAIPPATSRASGPETAPETTSRVRGGNHPGNRPSFLGVRVVRLAIALACFWLCGLPDFGHPNASRARAYCWRNSGSRIVETRSF